jgi:hypothetical protein
VSQGSTGSPRKAPGSSRSSKRGFTILPLLPGQGRASGSGRNKRASATAEETPPGGSVLSSNVTSLARGRLLIWACPRGENLAYEVSKAVNAPLQSRCKSAPLCPGESPQDGLPGWIQPNGAPVGPCPYDYETRGQCISDRNIEALVAALFLPAEARLVSNYLNALGYNVREEEFPPESLDGTRILNAHARIGSSHEVRVMGAPGVGEIVLVRDLADDR